MWEYRELDLTCPKCRQKDALRARVIEVYAGIKPCQEALDIDGQIVTGVRFETEDMDDSYADAVYCSECSFKVQGREATEEFLDGLPIISAKQAA
jgi:hypothetical protein